MQSCAQDVGGRAIASSSAREEDEGAIAMDDYPDVVGSVLTNPGVERILQKEHDLGANIKFEDIAPEVAGIYGRIMKGGEVDIGAWSCGMVAGLINDIPTVAQLIDRIMSDARSIIEDRLAGLLHQSRLA